MVIAHTHTHTHTHIHIHIHIQYGIVSFNRFLSLDVCCLVRIHIFFLLLISFVSSFSVGWCYFSLLLLPSLFTFCLISLFFFSSILFIHVCLPCTFFIHHISSCVLFHFLNTKKTNCCFFFKYILLVYSPSISFVNDIAIIVTVVRIKFAVHFITIIK